jgi:hypothetical protein
MAARLRGEVEEEEEEEDGSGISDGIPFFALGFFIN